MKVREAGYSIYSNLQPYHYTNGDKNTIGGRKASAYNYVRHLKDYVEKFNPNMLSFDYYPFDQDRVINGVSGDVEGANQYFKNLAMVRSVAEEKGIPFWAFVQAGTNWPNDGESVLDATTNNVPTAGEFKWNANTALAFGAKGIQYFPMIQPEPFAYETGGGMDYRRNGLIGADGKVNSWYSYAQQVNAQIAAVDHVLMNATNEGLMSTGGYAKSQATDAVASIAMYEKKNSFQYTEKDPLTTPILTSYADATVTVAETNVTYGALTGCFTTADGRHALYIVNYDPTKEATITVNLGSEKAVSITADAVTEEMTAASVTKTVGAGEAMLVIF